MIGLIPAFAASNVVPPSSAGDGNSAVTGYNFVALNTGASQYPVIAIYNAVSDSNANDPRTVVGVRVMLDNNATQVYVNLSDNDNPDSADGTWSNLCTGGPATWTCMFPAAVTLTAAAGLSTQELMVVATG